jgi:hypothetical protein
MKKPQPACGRGFYRLTQFKPLGPWLRLSEDGDEATALQQDKSMSVAAWSSTHNIRSRNGEPRLMLAARASVKNACVAVIRQRVNVAQSHLLSASALRQFNTTGFHGTFKI